MKSFLNCIQCILLLAAGVMVGCGGGGGGGSSASGSGGGSGVTVTNLPETASEQLAATARNRPRFGSVNQGPRALGSRGGETADTAVVAYPDRANGAVRVTANLRGIEPVSTTHAPTPTAPAGRTDFSARNPPTNGHESESHTYEGTDNIFEQVQNPAGREMRYVSSFDGDIHIRRLDENGYVAADNGYFYDHGLEADFFTTYDGTNADYLTFGQWLYRSPGTGRRLAEIIDGERTPTLDDFFASVHYGLFVDGPETTTSTLPTTGNANYAGFTYGYGDSSTLDYVRLLGRVRLTATFGGARNTQVEGTISDFAYYTGIDSPSLSSSGPFLGGSTEPAAGSRDPGWGTVYLQAATINNGQFEGDTSRRQNGPDMGNWGGQFFGNDGANVAPPMIGGTWGVADETNGVRMTGAFGTWKEPPPGN